MSKTAIKRSKLSMPMRVVIEQTYKIWFRKGTVNYSSNIYYYIDRPVLPAMEGKIIDESNDGDWTYLRVPKSRIDEGVQSLIDYLRNKYDYFSSSSPVTIYNGRGIRK